ncbi:hypothetical protein M885DRAFT_79714 [Pelagophyceae sp. CCMP2097]|nr:hypothetical protein M885DRAFT_79714 [Pelagophyceae sp. CCMP2097]
MPPAARPPAGKFHGSGEGVLVCIMKAFMDKQPLTGKGKTQKWEEVVKALLIEHNMKLSTAGAIEYGEPNHDWELDDDEGGPPHEGDKTDDEVKFVKASRPAAAGSATAEAPAAEEKTAKKRKSAGAGAEKKAPPPPMQASLAAYLDSRRRWPRTSTADRRRRARSCRCSWTSRRPS